MSLSKFSAAVLPLILNSFASAQQKEPTVFTYVAEWQVERASWDDFSAYFETNAKPVLDKLTAGGTLVEWGRSMNLIHSDEGSTHSLWWSATSFAGTQKVLEEFEKFPPRPPGVKKHHDQLLRSLVYRSRTSPPTSAYLSLNYTLVKPGKAQEWRALFEKNAQPTLEKLFDERTILGYGIDVEDVHTENPGGRYAWILAPTAEALDAVDAAFAALREKQTPDERKAMAAAYLDVTVPEAHRDGLARVINWVHK